MLGEGALDSVFSKTGVPLDKAGLPNTMLAGSSDLGLFCARDTTPLRFALFFAGPSEGAAARIVHLDAAKAAATI